MAPTGLNITFTSSTGMALAWDAAQGATKYLIFRGFTPGTETAFASVAAPTTTYGNGRLSPGTQYCWVLRYVNTANQVSDPTPSVCGTTSPLPDFPSNVVATANSSSRITVTWTAVEGATNYVVDMAVVGAGPPVFLASVPGTATSAVAANLSPGTTYEFDVRVITPSGVSLPSTPLAIATTFALGLEAYWKLDEDTGTVALDSTPFHRDGVLTDGAAFSNDKPNVLDNKSTVDIPAAGGKISVPNSSVLSFVGTSFSVSLWVKVPQAAPSVPIIGLRSAGCGSVGWEIAQDATSLFFADGPTLHRFGGAALPVGTWTHVAVTFDGATLRQYVNGVQAAAERATPVAQLAGGRPLEIGHVGDCAGGDVRVDEVQIYSVVLSADQIAALGTLPDPPTGLTLTVESSAGETLTWPAIPGAAKYFIYKGTVSGDEVFATSFPADEQPSFGDGHLDPATQYSWQIAVVKGTLFSNRSNEVIGTTLPGPVAPSNVTATAVSSSRIRIDWSPEPRATAYFVFDSVNGGPFTFAGTASNGATTLSVTGLTSMTQYRFEVATHDTGNLTSAFSAPVSATTL